MSKLGVYFTEDIAYSLRAALIARFGYIEPPEGEFLSALDAIGASFGLERVQGVVGGWRWVPVEEK